MKSLSQFIHVMAKKKTTKKAAGKSAKKTSPKKVTKKSEKGRVNVVFMSDLLDGDTAIHMVGDASDFPGPPNSKSMEKMMRDVTKKLQSLNLSGDELENVDMVKLLNSMPVPSAKTPKEKAQELVDAAFESLVAD